jgi:hydroxymethylpyrimidine kinase/phosphomethylpyrimidine kinase
MEEHGRPPVCLTIAGLDPSGGAGTIADVKTFAAHGCFAAAAITSITFQNTRGVFGAVHQTAATVRSQVEPVFDDYDIAAVKTGMLPTREVIAEVAAMLESRPHVRLVVDPVIRSTSGFDLIDDHAVAGLNEKLIPLAELVTPNLAEAERLANITINSIDDIVTAARIIQQCGVTNLLIKGGHSIEIGDRGATDRLFLGAEMIEIKGEYIDTTATHGTGCTLAAAITANLAKGLPLVEAVSSAKEFVARAIRTAPGLGKGHSPINI